MNSRRFRGLERSPADKEVDVRTALVLGAGGLVGQAYHLGVLRALHESAGFDGREADVLVGTSAGSLVAAGLAGGLSAADLAAELLGEQVSEQGAALRQTRQSFIAVRTGVERPPGRGPLEAGVLMAAARNPTKVRPGSVISALLPSGRIDTDPIARGLRHLHGGDWPRRDLRICTVRARDARRVVFGAPGSPATDVGTAVAASCAIPAYFTPVRIEGLAYIDGGMHSGTNADVLLDEVPDRVVVVSPMSIGPFRRPPIDLGPRLLAGRRLAWEVRKLRRAGAHVVTVQPGPEDLDAMGINPMRGHRIEQIIDTASASMSARLRAQPHVRHYL
jgi:NTE family protein